MTALLCVAVFSAIIVVGWLAIGGDIVVEELRRAFIRWENRWNHPAWKPWPGCVDTGHGPRWEWLCNLADRITSGRCHD